MNARWRVRRVAASPLLGWALAAVFVVVAWRGYGWQGLVFAVTAVVFWLLLQFNRAMRALRNAATQPLGHVPNAVMFHARLVAGMTMLEVVTMTKSLGERLDAAAAAGDRWRWHDEAGDAVDLVFERARLARWSLARGAVAVGTASAE